MKKTRHTNIPAVYLLLERDNKTLLARRFNTGYGDGKYSLVAGHLEPGETFTYAIIREAKEEVNIELNRAHMKVVHIMHRKSEDGDERVDVFVKASMWGGELKNLEPHKCDHMEWFEYDNLPENTLAHVRFAFDQIKQGNYWSEFNW